VSGAKGSSALRAWLNEATMKALQRADLRAKLQKTGLDPQPTSPEEFGKLIRSEIEKWGDVIESAGIPKV
jgi:tripartite-type tricarboxylate transporter receptor subunit TctC